jgi:hypothetical protein
MDEGRDREGGRSAHSEEGNMKGRKRRAMKAENQTERVRREKEKA